MEFCIDEKWPSASVFTTCFALVLSIGQLCISQSMVFYHYSNTPQLYAHDYHSCGTVVALPSEFPMQHTKFHWFIPRLITL